MNLIDTYLGAVHRGIIKKDDTQLKALAKLQRVCDELERDSSWWQRLISKKVVKGLYFYGSVGVGKTYLMDLFYDALSTEKKIRMHFHRFMQQVDKQLRAHQGEKNPLEEIAKEWASRARVLCFDEFFVHDIADAMILGRLLGELFKQGVTLIATSNIPPDRLYWQGLHRQRFLPTIELIKTHCEVYEFVSHEDYRLRELVDAGVYFTPCDVTAEESLNRLFTMYAHGFENDKTNLIIESRRIPCVKLADTIAWFEFDVLCAVPRSQLDYLALSERFHTLIVSNVPVMAEGDLASITYFINLVDVMYDNGVQLILSAEKSIEQLYVKGNKTFEYQRTMSRLKEMQSREYIELAIKRFSENKIEPSAQSLED